MTDLSFLAKATMVMVLGLAAARLLRRGRASVRHLVLASTFGTLLALPLAAVFMPTFEIEVAVDETRSAGAPARPESDNTATTSASGSVARAVLYAANGWPVPGWMPLWRSIWATGTAMVLASLAIGLWRLRRIRRAGLPCLDLKGLTRRLAADARVRTEVDVVMHEQIPAPLTCGLRRTTILLPSDIGQWSEEEISRAIVHELEHVRRADWMVQIAVRAVCALYWFHPLVWIAWRQLCLAAERACDDAVMQTAEGPEYAEQLVQLARRLSNSRAPLTLAMANRSDLSARVSALLDTNQRRGRAGVPRVAVALAGAAMVVLALAPIHVVAAPADSAIVETTTGATVGERVQRRRATAVDRALFRAAGRGDLTRITELLDAGANVNAALDGDGSPLIAAAREGQLAAVRLLLDRGADPNMPVPGDGNPLIMAAREGHADVVALLLDRGASIDRVVPSDENALIQASAEGELVVVKLLVARGADVNARVWVDPAYERPNGEWRTPLSMARRGRHNDVVAFLVKAGARE